MNAARALRRSPSVRNAMVIASPTVILLLGALAARVSIVLLGQWAWVGTFAVYWGSLALTISLCSGRAGVARWLGPSRGSRWWPVVALLVGVSSFPLLLLPNASLLRTPLLTGLWILFALTNGVLEEAYWRGLLFEPAPGLPRWAMVGYSSVVFVAIHFVMLGAISRALFNVPFLIILAALTAILSAMYLRTGSLRWPIVTHVMNDLGNMSIFVFMGLIHYP